MIPDKTLPFLRAVLHGEHSVLIEGMPLFFQSRAAQSLEQPSFMQVGHVFPRATQASRLSPTISDTIFYSFFEKYLHDLGTCQPYILYICILNESHYCIRFVYSSWIHILCVDGKINSN